MQPAVDAIENMGQVNRVIVGLPREVPAHALHPREVLDVVADEVVGDPHVLFSKCFM